MSTRLLGTQPFHFTRQFIVFSLTAVCVYLLWLGAQHVSAASSYLPPTQADTIYYVKTAATGSGDGSSWDNAATLQGALASATNGAEIWVAGGTYLPGNLQTDSFNLVPGVGMYGGFVGNESNRAERDWNANPTILSGDIGVTNDDNDNSYHVITADGTTGIPITDATILDGFTITSGQGYSPFPHDRGGGFYCLGNGNGNACSPSLTNITFLANGAAYGGAMFNYGNSSPILTNVIFLDNTSGFGAGMFNYGANGGTCLPQLTNVTFSQNRGVTGGAMYNYGLNNTTNPNLTNVILWGNSEYGEEIYNEDASITISNSLIQGGLAGIINSGSSSVIDGGNNLDTDPLFVDAANDNFHLQISSPAIDTGDDDASGLDNITIDLDGNPRFVDGNGDGTIAVDMGAYEFQSSCLAATTLFVDHSAAGNDSGDDWPNAQPDLAAALEQAANCNVSEIWVARGTYLPGSERTDSFNLAAGVALYGGFFGDETARSERDWAANPTILSGDIGTPDDNSDNSYHVVYAEGAAGTVITSTTILDGFTITKGHANGQPENNQGGGLYCNGIGSGNECSPSLSNLIFQENTASFWGGGIYNRGDSGVSSPSLTNISFFDNTADRGAAIYNYGANGVSSPSLTNVTFSGNNADRGGAMYSYGFNGDSSPILVNTILWGDNASIGSEIYNDSATPIISNSLLQGGIGSIFNDGSSNVTDGGNNIDVNPQFVDAPNGDLRLQVGSPAIDKGDNNAPGLAGVTTDLDNNPRLVDGDGDNTATVDMGAYENQTTPTCPATTTLFVDYSAAGNNSGDDWPNAQPDLALALTDAVRCDVDEIWVVAGTYYPGSARTDSFNLAPGVAVYGGFAGNETERDERDWVANPTILSGDIDNGSSYHVVWADGTTGTPINETTILDGFIITDGHNSSSGSDESFGGSFYCNGAGVGNECSPALANIIFLDNVGLERGGGMYNVGRDGGKSNPILKNVTFSGNAAYAGGGLYNDGQNGESSPTLINVTFSDNLAGMGGAMFNSGQNGKSDPSLVNVIFLSNTGNVGNGGMFNGGNSSPSLTNVTFFGNVAADESGILFFGSGNPNMTNVVFWGNTSPNGSDIHNYSANLTISYSLIQEGLDSIIITDDGTVIDGGNNLDVDPLFVDAANGDLRLQVNSPAIDKGDNNAPGLNGITTDIDGNPRFVDGDNDGTATADMGAYEYQLPCPATTTLFVNHSAAGDNSGDDWSNAQPDLAVALTKAVTCNVDEVWVAAGTYLPGNERTDSFNLAPGIAVYGGFAGDETEREERDWATNPTILSGDIGIPNDTSDNSYHVVYAEGAASAVITSTTVLDGFTIANGNANGYLEHDQTGAGFFCNGIGSSSDCSPDLKNIVFNNNSSTYVGGAMLNVGSFNGNSSPSLTNVTFTNNSAVYGGAMANAGHDGSSNPSLINVTFSNNSATSSGGAMYNNGEDGNSNPNLFNVTFFENSAGYGGAIYNSSASPNLNNVTFSDNSAIDSGGALRNVGSVLGDSNPILINVILWGNSAPFGAEIYNHNDAVPTISYSLIQGGFEGIFNSGSSSVTDGGNNLDVAPLFVDAVNGDLRLQVGSPAIDAGDDGVCPVADLDGVQRPLGTACDMGAYEFWGLAITAVSSYDAELVWQDPTTSCTYDVFESSEPYFTPTTPTYLNVTSAHPLNGRLGDPLTNYFFINRATCAGGTMVYSNTVGEFDFALVPGSE